MRITEPLMYFLGVCLAVTYFLEEFLICLILVAAIIVVTLIGVIFEGIRFIQWVFLIAFTSQIVLIVMDVYSVIALIIYSVFLLFSITLYFIYGGTNFNKIEMSGPFQVGYKEFYNQKDGIAISVWYPMDREEFTKTMKDSSRNVKYFRYGFKSRFGLSRATAAWGEEEGPSPWFYKYMDDVKLDVCMDGKIAKVYEDGSKKIVPLIYSHGLTCNRISQSVSCRDFASHGHIVFSLDHFDGTAYCSIKKNGETKYWSSNHDQFDKQLRLDQLEIRRDEVVCLIDELSTDDFCKKYLEFDQVKLDLDKLIMGGHSFGGMTSIKCAKEDERIKAVYALDPWIWFIYEDIQSDKYFLKQP